MILRWSLRPNAYHDSVRLMRVSEALSLVPGVAGGAAVMATPLNLELLAADGLLPDGMQAQPEDLLVTVLAEDDAAADAALAQLEGLLAPKRISVSAEAQPARTLEAAADRANLAVIAVPGQYAVTEAMAALRAGLHVFLFSDNVSVQDEIRLKRLADERDLLMMGPDCGTAIIGGVGLGFANRVRPGPVGIVGASGTGIQQLCCLLDEQGVGIAAAIGTGGRDLSAVGGLTTRRALRDVESDERVEIIAVVSKASDAGTGARLSRDLERLSKPSVVCLLGDTSESTKNIRYVATLTEAASAIRDALGLKGRSSHEGHVPPPSPTRAGRVYGLFAGGTLCHEARLVLDSLGAPHHLIDLGADEYTRGRAHPMIDPRLRASMLGDLSGRSDVGAVLLDVILGDLAHPDPSGSLLPAIAQLRDQGVPVVATLIGTRADPQGLDAQRSKLEESGALVFSSNAAAARMTGAMLEATA